MSVRTDVINLQVNVNNNQAQNQLNELRKKAKDIAFEMDGLKKNTQEYIDKKAQLKQVTTEMDGLKKQIGLSALSQKELNAELNKLKALRGSTVPFSKEFEEFSKQIQKVESRLYDVKNGVQGFASFFSKIKDEVKQFGIMAAGYLGFQFISSQFQNIIRGAGKMSDQLADLQRVAGLTGQEATNLNNRFKELNTRTTTEGLREISIIAGKLGVAKDDIYDFTAAVDQLVVALGDELGNADQITTQLGKILNVFDGEISAKGITNLGNAFVQLANTGSATGAFIADFDQRLSGIAKSAGIGLGQLSGLGAGLEEMGARVESSSTAIQKLIISISADLPAAAKIAGVSTEAFTKLFKTDATEALLKYSEGLVKNKNSFAEVTAGLKDAGEEGARTIETITKLGTNSDQLRKRIDLGAKSLQESSAITEAFALKNETFGATLDKLGKEFNKLITSPGLQNFLKGAVEGALSFIKALRNLPQFISENRVAVLTLVAGIVLLNRQYIVSAALTIRDSAVKLYNTLVTRGSGLATQFASIATAAYITVTNLLTGRITLATAAQRLWSIALSVGLGPLGVLLTVIGAVAVAFGAFSTKLKEVNAQQKVHMELQQKISELTAEEETKARSLFNAITKTNIGYDEKKKLLAELIAINPQYLNGLTLENIQTEEGAKILGTYIEKLREANQIKARNQLILEKEKQRADVNNKIEDAYTPVKNSQGQVVGKEVKNTDNSLYGAVKSLFVDNEIDKLNKNKEELKQLDAELETLYQSVSDSVKTTVATTAEGSTAVAGNVVQTVKTIKEQIKALDDAYEGIDISNKKALQSNRANRKALQDQLDRLEGKDNKKGGGKSDDNKLAQLKKDAEAFAKELKKIKAEADRGNLSDYQREIALVEEKYRELIDRARKYWTENSAIGKQKFEEIKAIRDAQLNLLMNKQIAKIDEADYGNALKKLDNYFDAERNARGREYAAGKLTKKEYESELTFLEATENKSRILVALQYSQTVKKAAADITVFQKKEQEQQTKDAIEEFEKRRKETVDNKLAGARLKVLTSPKGSQAELDAKRAELQLKFDLETEYMDQTSNMYLEKQAELNEQLKNMETERVQSQIDQMSRYVGYFIQALTSLNQIITNKENRELQKEKARNNEKKKSLKNALDNKLISQAQYDKKLTELQEEQDRKERELKRKQAKREKALNIFRAIVNVAAGVASSLSYGGPVGIALAAITAVLGALEIAAIASAPLPEMGRGGEINNGPQHSDSDKGLHLVDPRTGRTEMLLEKGEGVLSKKTMESNTVMTVTGTPKQIASGINAANGGASFASGALINYKPMWMKQPQQTIKPGIVTMMAQGGVIGGSTGGDDGFNTAALMQMQTAEIQALRKDMQSWQTKIKGQWVIKDLDDTRALYDNAKKASSISQ